MWVWFIDKKIVVNVSLLNKYTLYIHYVFNLSVSTFKLLNKQYNVIIDYELKWSVTVKWEQ